MKRRILSVFMALCLTLTLVPAVSASETTGEDQTPAAAGDTTGSPDETPEAETPTEDADSEKNSPESEPTATPEIPMGPTVINEITDTEEGTASTAPDTDTGNPGIDTYEELKDALAGDAETITLTGNIDIEEGPQNNLVIGRNVTIDGQGHTISKTLDETPISDGYGNYEAIFQITGGNTITIRNLTMTGLEGGTKDEAAIYIASTSDVTVEDCTFTGTSKEGNSYGSAGIIGGSGYAPKLTVSGCRFENVKYSMYLNGTGSGSSITGNKITNTSYTGIYLIVPDTSANVTVSNNTLTGIGVGGGDHAAQFYSGIWVDGNKGAVTATGNNITLGNEVDGAVTSNVTGMTATVTPPEEESSSSSGSVTGNFTGKENTTGTEDNEGSVNANGTTVTIDVTTGTKDSGSTAPVRNEQVTDTTVTVAANSVSSLATEHIEATLHTDVATLEIPAEAWNAMNTAAGGQDVKLSVEKDDSNGKLVYTLEATTKDGTTEVFAPSETAQGTITVTVPYEGATAYVYYLGENGPELITNSEVADGKLSWTVEHFSQYDVRSESSVAAYQKDSESQPTYYEDADALLNALGMIGENGGTLTLFDDVELKKATAPVSTTKTDYSLIVVGAGKELAILSSGENAPYTLTLNYTVGEMNPDKEEDSAKMSTAKQAGAIHLSSGSALNLGGVKVAINGMEVRGETTTVRVGSAIRFEGATLTLNDATIDADNLSRGLITSVRANTVNLNGTSRLGITNVSGNATNGGTFNIADRSTVYINGAGDNGLSAGSVTVKDTATVDIIGTGGPGINITGETGKLDLQDTAKVTVTDCSTKDDDRPAVYVVEDKATLTTEEGTTLKVTGTDTTVQLPAGASTDSIQGGFSGSLQVGTEGDPQTYWTVMVNNGDEVVDLKTVADNEEYTLPEKPTSSPANQFFAGWSWSAAGKTYQPGDKVTVTQDMIFDAVWQTAQTGGDSRPSYPTGGSTTGGSSSSSGNLVTVDRTTGGTVQVRPGRAESGDTVTITATPNEGYEVESVTVTDSRGNEISVRSAGNDRYTFTMPNSKVDIDVNFVRIGGQQPAPQTGFRDVSAAAYYYDAVQWAVEQGITTGTTATTFNPNGGCTRAQIVTFLWRANGSPAPRTTSNPFTDVSANAYYYDAVLWAVEQGITSGTTATTFGPNSGCTRAQAATFLWRSEGSPAAGGSSFSDVADGAYYAGAVDWAVANGVTQGTTATTFSPNTACTRAQIVTFLYRALA